MVGVPIAINELYKQGTGYITVWNGADILSFYGTMLGTGATILALVITIVYTRKQISRDNYLKSKSEKWAKIESIFATALDTINPMRPLTLTMGTGHTDPSATILTLQKYIHKEGVLNRLGRCSSHSIRLLQNHLVLSRVSRA